MTLALPLRQPGNQSQVLLHAGYVLTQSIIERLREIKIREVTVTYPGLEKLECYINSDVLQRRSAIASSLDLTFRSIQREATANIPYERYLSQIGELVENLLSNPTSLLFMDEAANCQPTLLEHASAVSYLSLLMALKLDAYIIRQRRALPPRHARALGNLGLGAMLHDIGRLKLEPHVMARYEETGNTEDPAWRAHTRIGYELVRGQVEPTAAVVVLDHHQCFDGSGFPARRRLDGRAVAPAGERIHIFARIAAVANTFHNMRCSRTGQVPTVRVLRQMLSKPMVNWFDPQVLRALLMVVPPYPPLLPVRLSNGKWAVPLEHNYADPCRPRVQIIADMDGRGDFDPTLDGGGDIIDLAESDILIATAEDQDVLADNFRAPQFERDPSEPMVA